MAALLVAGSLTTSGPVFAATCPRTTLEQGQWIAALCSQAGETSTRPRKAKPGEKLDSNELDFAGQCIQANVIKKRFDTCLKRELCAKDRDACHAMKGQYKLLTLMNHSGFTGLTQRGFRVCLPANVSIESVDNCMQRLTTQMYYEVLRPNSATK